MTQATILISVFNACHRCKISCRRGGLLLFMIFLMAAAEQTGAQSKIQGRIVDSAWSPVANANVLLLNSKDSVLVKGLLSSENGFFLFENVKPGSYLLSATHTGVNPVYGNSFEIGSKEETIEMGTIRINEKSVTLAQVTVTARKPLYEQKIDRLQINVAASIILAGSSVLDVLERSPGIRVSRMANSISMNGKGGVIVMINGKRNYMDISAVVQMLANMPASNVERIEIITTPPANFDADGDAGIINIVLKSNNQFGTNGSYSLTLGYNKGEQTSASINLNHRQGKVNLFGNYSFSRARLYQLWTYYHAVKNNSDWLENYSQTERHALAWQQDLQAGLDYEINKKTIIGTLFTGNYRHWSMDADNSALTSKNYLPDTAMAIDNHELHTTGSYGINLNVQHTFKPEEKFILNLDYLKYNDDNPNDYNNSYYDASRNFLYNQQVKSSKMTPLNFWIAAADYQRKLSKKLNMEAGLKATLSHLTNDVVIQSLVQNYWKRDSSLSGFHTLNESIGAAYTSFSYVLSEKTSLKLGLRYEYTNSNLASDAEKNIVDRHYGNLFPSFFFLHSFGENSSVNFSYSRRIWRPSFQALAPWVIFYDPKTFQTGNPGLQPTITDAANASYTYKNKMISLSYSYMSHPMTMNPKTDDATNRVILALINGENARYLSASLSLPVKITKWWNTQTNLDGSWNHSNTFYKTLVKTEGVSGSAQSTFTFTLAKNFTTEISGSYYSGGNWGLYKSKGSGSLDFGLQKKFEKMKSTLAFNIRNILNSLSYTSYINMPEQNLFQKNTQDFSYTNFSITFSQRFGNDKVKDKRDRTTGAEDERGRAY